MKKSLRIDEAAKEFDISRRTLYRLIQKGEVETYKLGHNRRITAEEIDRVKKIARDDR